jgi:hypothetical protein
MFTEEDNVEVPYFLVISPTDNKVYTAEDLRAVVSISNLIPTSEVREKYDLKERGFKQPAGLFGYSAIAEYKDLYAYFDSADKSSPENYAATQAFKMYGLNGNQMSMDWDIIRGKVFVCRQEPNMSFCSSNLGTKLSKFSLIETLMFFVGRDARRTALKRDSLRMLKYVGGINQHPFVGPSYLSPLGVRTQTQLEKDSRHCNYCDKAYISTEEKFFTCSRCRKTCYCGKVCQKADWKTHKPLCIVTTKAP